MLISSRYFEEREYDYIIRHPDHHRRTWGLHLDVARKSTKWFDWRIHKGEKVKHTLPSMVRIEQIPSLLHFLYTGDYSVDVNDMSQYSVRESPDGCITCPQICQLLRVHLAMFQTGIRLGIVELQALAFGRFQALLNTAPAWVLKYAVHAVYSRTPIHDAPNAFRVPAIEGLMDYRPELVLPAVLRWCGYYRINPGKHSRRASQVHGEQEFAELRRKIAPFNTHLTFGLWLDTVDIRVPRLKFPGKSAPMLCIHPYLRTTLPPMARDFRRSNYQYATYLQPLPFRNPNERRPSNKRSIWATYCASSSSLSIATQSDLPEASNSISTNSLSSQISGQESVRLVQPTLLEQDLDLDMLDPALFNTNLDRTTEPLPQDSPLVDHMDTPDALVDEMLDLDFPNFPNGSPTGLRDNGLGITQEIHSSEANLGELSFTDLLNSNTLDLSLDTSNHQWSHDVDVDMSKQYCVDIALTELSDSDNNEQATAQIFQDAGLDKSNQDFGHASETSTGFDELAQQNHSPIPQETTSDYMEINSLGNWFQDLPSAAVSPSLEWSKAIQSAIDKTVSSSSTLDYFPSSSSRYHLRTRKPTTVLGKNTPPTPFKAKSSQKPGVASIPRAVQSDLKGSRPGHSEPL